MADTIETSKDSKDHGPLIIGLNLADSKVPIFKEVRNKDFILYGEDNKYPDYLTYQYNKSPKHNAIINGKCNYILGSGFEKGTPMEGSFSPYVGSDGQLKPGCAVNSKGETMADIWKRTVKDIEIYGGFRWFVIWDAAGRVKELHHVDFYKIRTGKEKDIKDEKGKVIGKENGGYWYKKDWSNNREEAIHYNEFDDRPLEVSPTGTAPKKGTQVFAYNEYRPGCEYYPLPSYVACCNWIEVDIEISIFHLSSLRNGMMPSKMIQFFNGEPQKDIKKQIERDLKETYAGSGNAGKFFLIFNKDKNAAVQVDDLSFNELDKQFEVVNKSAQQEILTGHQVTSPMLFGIKTEGQLGGSTELKIAYEIFINTYAKPKQDDIETIVNRFGGLMGKGTDYYIKQLDPVGVVLDVGDVIDKLPNDFVYDKLNVPKEYRTATPAAVPGTTTEVQQAAVNDNVKNLTAKQHQQLVRIIRQHSKGQLNQVQATALLKTGLGLSDADIASLLGIEEDLQQVQQFAAQVFTEEVVAQMFEVIGDAKADFHIVTSKRVKFESDQDAANDELQFYHHAFKSVDVTNTEASIIDLIKKDSRVTPQIIADTIKTTPEYVTAKIASLTKRGIIKINTEVIGEDNVIERTVSEPIRNIKPPDGTIETAEILIKYSYEGPKDSRNRPFCKKLLELDRLYSRAEIESISQRLGYSVWDRRGGWWTQPDGTRSPSCRHRWESHIVVKKGGKV